MSTLREKVIGHLSALPDEDPEDLTMDTEQQDPSELEVREPEEHPAPPVEEPSSQEVTELPGEEETPPPSPSSDDPPSWFKEHLDQQNKKEEYLQQLLFHVVQGRQPAQQQQQEADEYERFIAPTGVKETGDEQDEYFLTRDDMIPFVKTLKATGEEMVQIRENNFNYSWEAAEKSFAAKYGDEFEKYVTPERRAKVRDALVNKIRAGQQPNVNLTAMFQDEYDRNEIQALRADRDQRLKQEKIKAEQEQELRKLDGMPGGATTTTDQAPKRPKRKEGGNGFDAMRDGVMKLLRKRKADE